MVNTEDAVVPSDQREDDDVYKPSRSDQDVLKDARDHMSLVQTMESDIRKEGAKCNEFRALRQWDKGVLDTRGIRPSLVIDQINQYPDQVINDWKRNRLGVSVSPSDAPADDETAQVIESYIRQVEYQSKAYVAYDKAFECMCTINRGFFKLSTKRRPRSFKQDICVRMIANPDNVYMDPFCREIDYSDMRRCLIVERLGHSIFREEFGNRVSLKDFESYAEHSDYVNWITKEAVTVGEWWVVEFKKRKIQMLTKPIAVKRDGQMVKTDIVYNWDYGPKTIYRGELPEGVHIANYPDGTPMEDDEPEKVIWQYLLNGVQILDRTRWLGSFIPVIPMLSRELYLDGKKHLFGLLSRGLDTQRTINYAVSTLAERLSQFPKMPVMGLTGQFATDREAWKKMNTELYTYVQFDPVKLPDVPIMSSPRQLQTSTRIWTKLRP